ncbi:MAG: copper resistance protein CopC, partial [Chloroflexota bacterium]
MSMKKLAPLFLVVGLLVLGVTQVSAHASLVRADPPPNSVLSQSPSAVTLWFDEDLDAQFSAATV